LCVKCGFDLRTGRKLQTQRVASTEGPAAPRKPAARSARTCHACGAALLAKETRCSKCKARNPLEEKTPSEEAG
jgi:hypothetical protein